MSDPANPAPAAAQTILSSAFHTLLGNLTSDLVESGSGLLENYFDAVEKNPSPSNVVAQSIALVAAAPLALPNLEQAAAQQAAAVGKTLTAQLAALAKAKAASL